MKSSWFHSRTCIIKHHRWHITWCKYKWKFSYKVHIANLLCLVERDNAIRICKPSCCVAVDRRPGVILVVVFTNFLQQKIARRYAWSGSGQWSSTEKNWAGPSEISQLCSRHFAFVSGEKEYQEELLGIPPQKRLKLDTVPTIFPKSVDYLEASCSTSMTTRPWSKWRQQKSVRK